MKSHFYRETMTVLANLQSTINMCSHPELSLFARTKGSQKINSVQGKLIYAGAPSSVQGEMSTRF